MRMRLMIVPAMLLIVVAAGCAKRPATSLASAPPPSGASGSSSGPVTTVGPASTSSGSTSPGSMSRAATATARPQPADFRPTAELKDIHFDFDKYDIRPGDARTLDANATWLKNNTNMLVLIEGHCDERGTNEYNLALGERRAKATVNYLISQGVAQSRLSIISYGEERPVCTDHNEACWAKNRRAHFLVKAQ